MKKPAKIILIFCIAAVIILASLFYFYNKKQNEIVLFYGEECPHCKIVEEFISSSGIGSKLTINQKEVFHNPVNQAEFVKVIAKCKIDSAKAGVPLAYTEGKCYEGDQKVIEMLKFKAGITQSSIAEGGGA